MLYEINKVKQDSELLEKKCFADDYFDLVVWRVKADRFIAFELSYNKLKDQHCIRWSKDRGFRHSRVDEGDESPRKNQSPLLLSAGDFPKEKILAKFLLEGTDLESEVFRFVKEKLESYTKKEKQDLR
jgi:hypothetical protein